MRSLRLALAVWALGAALLFGAEQARAESSGAKAAAAEALFEQGVVLMDQGDYDRACQKFEGSLQLDSALGAMLRLADCYDRLGRTASAWSTFRDAVSSARASKEVEREQMAAERAADAEARLSKLKLEMSDRSARKSLTIRLNGTVLPPATWDDPIPVDPGPQRIEASAPDRLPWSTTLDIPRGPTTREVVVPALVAAPGKRPPAPVPAPPPAPTSPGPFYEDLLGDTLLVAGIAAGGIGTYFLVKGNSDMLGADNAETYQEYDAIATRAAHEQLAGTIALAGGGALLAGALLRYATRGGSARSEQSALMVGPKGVVYWGRF